MKPLREIVTILKGSKAPEVFDEPKPGAFPYLQIEDLRPDATPKYAIDEDGTLAKKTDVIIAWDGANAGTVGFDLEGYISSTIAILRPMHDDIHAPYLGYFLRSKFKEIQENATGATIPHVSRSYLENLKLPLPPLSEQKRIASLLRRADRPRQLRRAAHDLGDSLLQSVFLEMFGFSATNSMGWKLMSLGQVCDEIYRYPTFHSFDYVEEGVPVVRIRDILLNGKVNPNLENYVRITSEINKRFPRTILQLGDILMAVRGDGSTGKRIGMVKSKNLVGSNINPNLLRFKANKNYISSSYLFCFMT